MIRIQVSYWLVNNTLSTYTLIANSGTLKLHPFLFRLILTQNHEIDAITPAK